LSDQTLDRIEQELRLLNVNLAEANDLAMLSAFTPIPANLDDIGREALAGLRDQMIERARIRANT
jgi:hypothetical protein